MQRGVYMNWEQLPLGPLQTNCYIISNREKECLVIDPGSEGNKLIQHLQKRGLKPVAVLLTHGHFDHIGAVDDVRNEYKVPVYIHRLEKSGLVIQLRTGQMLFLDNLLQLKTPTI